MGYGFNSDKSKHEIYQIKKKTFTFGSSVGVSTFGAIGETLFNAIKDIYENVEKIVLNEKNSDGTAYRTTMFYIDRVTFHYSTHAVNGIEIKAYYDYEGGTEEWFRLIPQSAYPQNSYRKIVRNLTDPSSPSYTSTLKTQTDNYTWTSSAVITFDIFYHDEVKAV